jgi:hypothetical protein
MKQELAATKQEKAALMLETSSLKNKEWILWIPTSAENI